MKRVCCTILAVGLLAGPAFAQAPRATTSPVTKEPLVEFGMMTWPEVKAAMAAGKTTALVYTGGAAGVKLALAGSWTTASGVAVLTYRPAR